MHIFCPCLEVNTENYCNITDACTIIRQGPKRDFESPHTVLGIINSNLRAAAKLSLYFVH